MVITDTDTLEDIDTAMSFLVKSRRVARETILVNCRRIDRIDTEIAQLLDQRCDLLDRRLELTP